MKITSPEFYKLDNGLRYDVVSDFVRDLKQVPLENVDPVCPVEIELSDCFVDEKGNLYTPEGYRWVRKGYGEDDYLPLYGNITLTNEQINQLVDNEPK